ncbi:MAG: hypothetical protein MOGMAGMI_01078 [Candidatus Omnitrophica bacterium]|nr:hypothetical protein [Candidatus Omnitrophota bacterium]
MNHRPQLRAIMLVALLAAGLSPAAAASDAGPHRPEDLSLLHQGEIIVGSGFLRTEIASTDDGKLFLAGSSGPSEDRAILVYAVDPQLRSADRIASVPTAWFGAEPIFRLLGAGSELALFYQSPDGSGGEVLHLVRWNSHGEQRARSLVLSLPADVTGPSGESLSGFGVAWLDGMFLLCTAGPGDRLTLRKLTPEGVVLEERVLDGFFEGAFEAGLALGLAPDRKIVYYSARDGESWVLKAAELDAHDNPQAVYQFENDDRQQKMPSGSLVHKDLYFVTYVSTPRWEEPGAPERSDAYLQVMDRRMEVWADFKVGERGQLPARPTLARVGDRIFVSWLSAPASPAEEAYARIEAYELKLAPPAGGSSRAR